MSMKNRPKNDYLFDMAIKTLYFSGRLLKEHGNFDWVPGWLVSTLGINACAVGITKTRQCVVCLNAKKSTVECTQVDLDTLKCYRHNSSTNRTIPCNTLDCPVRQSVLERCGRPGYEVTCFPMSGKHGFIMACGEGELLNSFPVTEILRGVTHVIECSLDTVTSEAKDTTCFLPSEDMAQMWSEMLAGLSHDLRTPLACIKGYVTTLLREDVAWDAETQKEFLNIIVEETDYIESLINNLLDSSTLSWKGEIELKKEPISLPQIAKKVLKDPSYRKKNHEFIMMFPEDFPLVEADLTRIEQVLRNLVDNAVKYSNENTQITIKGELTPEEIIISVADQGIGIGDEHLNQLFEKFFRITNNKEEYQKGMGLGLPLARQIVINHGGRIWAKSKLNYGTTLYFTLPVSSATAI
jgi:K+-sensing histidine kinase KdpD